MKAMILAAGRGERLGSLTLKTPKPLTDIRGKKLIEYNLLKLKESGINEVVINISWLGNKIKEYLGNGDKWSIKIIYSNEGDNLLGTGGGILNALPLLGNEPFWLINSDIYSNYKIDINCKLNPNFVAKLILVPNPDHNKDGDFSLEGGKTLFPKLDNNFTFSGISLISPTMFYKEKKLVFPLEPILENYARLGKISGELYKGFWMDIGTQDRLDSIRKILDNNMS